MTVLRRCVLTMVVSSVAMVGVLVWFKAAKAYGLWP